ncbi:helix-turn-helix domain-containing protein [Ideonella sp. B508-1]|nr:helix-turn-helix domain-containing protein [Ideonella sp. B508-1]
MAGAGRSQGNLSGAARLLQMTRPQLAYRLKRRQSGEAPAPAEES